ncbi:ATP-binding cassette domain-containing protein [Macrococcus capreoli]|uniref:ATP-binding cassette domain-containing protein n=1 Tax=Macrococcus capreoli TaxID=2982690 RepID=UPI0021D605AF|nr:ATP-binding cassette domain-containing protein [Macrococcus sp. TMW 2.2395]MCU7557768.1 ATP-binding cassette domain-containing protein [Macrococcus sp. TMW 2.2395]
MSNNILVRLVNVTKYFRHVSGFSKIRDFIIPESKNHNVEVKDVTIHLYKGEILGLIGLPNSGKSVVGKLISKVVAPNEGRVKNDYPTFLASHNHIFDGESSVKQLIESIFLSYNLPLNSFNEKRKNVLEFSGLSQKEMESTNKLSTFERSKLMITLAYFLKPDVIIFDDLYHHLDDEFKKKFGMIIDLLVKESKSIVLIETDIDFIEKTANYITWMSHGQVRKSGVPSVIMPLYRNYIKDYESCRNDDERALFDLNYKMGRSLHHDEGDKLSRIKRYGSVVFDEHLQKLLTMSALILFGIALMFVLLLNNIGVPAKVAANEETSIVEKPKKAYVDKYAFGVTNKETKLTSENNSVTLPANSTLTISGINDQVYRVNFAKSAMDVNKKDIIYINPAALYDEHTFGELEKYMYSNYVNFREFFNGYLGKTHHTINKELYPESNHRYKVKLTKNKIYLHFNDANILNGISYPIENEAELKKKFGIEGDQWIVKIGEGYGIADFTEHEWLYIQM